MGTVGSLCLLAVVIGTAKPGGPPSGGAPAPGDFPDARAIATEARLQGATSDPSVVSWAPGRIDLFVRGSDNALWHKWYDGQWRAWESLGGSLTSGPDAASMGPNHLDVFARGSDGAVWHRWWNGSAWSNWESLSGQIVGDPSAVSWASGRIDLFVRGTDNALHHKWFEGQWSGWESLGGVLTSGPDAASMGPGHLEVFVRGTDGSVWHRWWSNGWSGWEALGGQIVGDPSAVSWANGRMDLFARGTDNTLQHRWFDGQWQSWESLGGALTSGPDAASMDVNHLDVYVRGTDNAVHHKWYNGGWSNWESLGVPMTATVVLTEPTVTTATSTPITTTTTSPTTTQDPPPVLSRQAPALRVNSCYFRTTGGPEPRGLTLPSLTRPFGATLTWTNVPGTAYVVERAVDNGAYAWTTVAACLEPTQETTRSLTDVTGGTTPGTQYVYRVTGVASDGRIGWNTVRWKAPGMSVGYPSATVSGSTVTVKLTSAPEAYGYVGCILRSLVPPVTSCDASSAAYFTVTPSFGPGQRKYVYAYANIGIQFFGVPVGTHSFTVTIDYNGVPGYVLRGGTVSATVTP